jgi:hypothetical protein
MLPLHLAVIADVAARGKRGSPAVAASMLDPAPWRALLTPDHDDVSGVRGAGSRPRRTTIRA